MCAFSLKYNVLSYPLLAGAAGGSAAGQAGRGVRHPVVGAHRVPLLHGAGTAHVALGQQGLWVIGQLRTPGAHRHENMHE